MVAPSASPTRRLLQANWRLGRPIGVGSLAISGGGSSGGRIRSRAASAVPPPPTARARRLQARPPIVSSILGIVDQNGLLREQGCVAGLHAARVRAPGSAPTACSARTRRRITSRARFKHRCGPRAAQPGGWPTACSQKGFCRGPLALIHHRSCLCISKALHLHRRTTGHRRRSPLAAARPLACPQTRRPRPTPAPCWRRRTPATRPLPLPSRRWR